MGLKQEQIDFFKENGYLVVEEALTKDDLEPLIDDYEQALERRAQERAAKAKITDLLADQPFDQRVIGLLEQDEDFLQGLDISLPLVKRLSPDIGLHCSKAVFDFLRNPRLLDLVEGLVGPRILSNPVQHIRPKIPNDSKTVDRFTTPWHQDAGVLLPEADGYFMLTTWIPLVDVPIEKGALEILPGSHKLSLLPHEIAGGGPSVVAEAIPDIQPLKVPIPLGGLLFMHNHMCHRTSPNLTTRARWTVDLRYQNPDFPTGRPIFPAFIARDPDNPSNELRDHAKWVCMWEDTRQRLLTLDALFHRWPAAATAPTS